jgi:hypothetical protein
LKVSRKKLAGLAIILFFVGMFLGIYLNESKGIGFTSLIKTGNQEQKACFKYVGSIPDAYCDSQQNLHFYFQGNDKVEKGWIVREKHEDCKPCDYVSEENE